MAKFLSYEGRLEIENGLKNINLMMDHINSYRKKTEWKKSFDYISETMIRLYAFSERERME